MIVSEGQRLAPSHRPNRARGLRCGTGPKHPEQQLTEPHETTWH
jgi:hypothetical protein